MHDLRVLQLGIFIAGLAREHHLCALIAFIEQPMNDVNLMNRRIVNRHFRGKSVIHFRKPVRAAQIQRCAKFAGVQQIFDLCIRLIKSTHKADLNQLFSQLHLDFRQLQRILCRCRQWLFAENRLACFQRLNHRFLVCKCRRGANDCIDIRIIDQIRTVAIHRCAQRITHLMGTLHIKIRYSNDLAAGKSVGNSVNMFASNGAASDDANS